VRSIRASVRYARLFRTLFVAAALISGFGLTVANAPSVEGASCLSISGGRFNAVGTDSRNLNGEYVVVKNGCSSTVSLRGWRIRDRYTQNTYQFPSTFRLGSGRSVFVHTGPGRNTATRLYWSRGREVWNNGTSERAYLAQPNRVVASTWPRASTPTPAPAPITTAACTRTVTTLTATAVHAARDAAGVGGVVCLVAGTYTGNLSATVANQTWRLDPATRLTGTVALKAAGLRFAGGTIERPAADRWFPSVAIRADDVTVEGVTFSGGGAGVGVYGRDRAAILDSDFSGLSGSAISIWSEGVGADATRIENNRIVQTITNKVSPITSRGNETVSHGGVQNTGTVIRGNTIDQGPGDVGWFGIELKQSRGALLEGNTMVGGHVLVSLPESDAVTIRGNTFDMRGSPHWGVEVANADDVIVERNTFIGNGTSGGQAISLNSGSVRTTARFNTARDLKTFFAVSGDGHNVTDNCFTAVAYEHEYRSSGGANITFSRNGACP
jgi:hypothetical protein